MDERNKRDVCRVIAGLVVSDDDLDPAEDAFMDKVLARFGVPADERDLIFPILDAGEAADALHAMPADVQQEAFSQLVEAAAVDGKVVDEEREFLRVVAAAVGVSDHELEARLSAALATGA